MVDTEKSYLKEQVESLEQQVKNLQGQAMALQSQLESSKAYIAHLEHKVAFLEEEKREQSPATCFLVFLVEKFRVSIYQLKWCFVKIAARIRAEVRLQAILPDWEKAWLVMRLFRDGWTDAYGGV
ncbi:hypothetical protein MP228_003287 [Amoeboaphelidium protococcarum]|nr:hypothetical protein MP228_003287 [Amoeboaphelidium protococcarum]